MSKGGVFEHIGTSKSVTASNVIDRLVEVWKDVPKRSELKIVTGSGTHALLEKAFKNDFESRLRDSLISKLDHLLKKERFTEERYSSIKELIFAKDKESILLAKNIINTYKL